MPDQQLQNILTAAELETWLAEKASAIRQHLHQSILSIVQAGMHLAEVKASLSHGQWLPWLEAEFHFSARTAERLISVYEMVQEHSPGDIEHISQTALYALAQSNTPTEVRQDLLHRNVTGDRSEHTGLFLTRSIVNGVTDAFVNFMESVDDLRRANDRVFGLAIAYDVSPNVVPMLSRIEAELPAVFAEIEASGTIENYDGESIPISEANPRDFAAFIDHNRFERQQRAITHRLNERVSIDIVLPDEKPKSLNQYYGRSHWSVRDKEQERVAWVMEEAIRHRWKVDYAPIDRPCRLTFTAYFRARPLDPDNIAVKPYIDALKNRLIIDDDWQHVLEVTLMSKMDRKNPRVEIELEFE